MWLAEGGVSAPSSFTVSSVLAAMEWVWLREISRTVRVAWVFVRLLGEWSRAMRPTRKLIRLRRSGRLVLVILFPWGGVGLSPWDRTGIGMWVVATGWSRVGVGLARRGLGLVVIPGGSVWLSTLPRPWIGVWLVPWKRARVGVRLLSVARENVWLAAVRGTRKGVWWVTFCGTRVRIRAARGSEVTGFVVGFVTLDFVVGLRPRRWVGMAWTADITVASLYRPGRVGIRMVPCAIDRKERVRGALTFCVCGRVQGGQVLVESSDGHG